jgi:hypothetical protein
MSREHTCQRANSVRRDAGRRRHGDVPEKRKALSGKLVFPLSLVDRASRLLKVVLTVTRHLQSDTLSVVEFVQYVELSRLGACVVQRPGAAQYTLNSFCSDFLLRGRAGQCR